MDKIGGTLDQMGRLTRWGACLVRLSPSQNRQSKIQNGMIVVLPSVGLLEP